MPTKVVRSRSTLGPRGHCEIGRKGGHAAARALVDEAYARSRLVAFNRLKPLANSLDTRIDACVADVLETYATGRHAQLAIGINPTTGFANTTAVTATATLTGTPTPTGSVQFRVNGVNVGAPQALVGGVASLVIAGSNFSAPSTAYTISYTYSGDGNYPAGISPGATYTTQAS